MVRRARCPPGPPGPPALRPCALASLRRSRSHGIAPARRAAHYGDHVRVIAGSSRGRKLPARLPGGVRPTSDRVREAIFDILGSMDAVAGAGVVDLYCGSGAFGLEALSRGADRATFVDHDPAALAAARVNLDATGLSARPAAFVRAELPGWLSRAPRFDLAFCDPPYAFDDWHTLLSLLEAEVAVLETGREVAVPDGWAITRTRRYGGTLVTVLRITPEHPGRRRVAPAAGAGATPGAAVVTPWEP